MKKVKFILNCIAGLIKKKIFKSQKTDISQECKKVLNTNEDDNSIEELKPSEDYTVVYNVTTRWQTL